MSNLKQDLNVEYPVGTRVRVNNDERLQGAASALGKSGVVTENLLETDAQMGAVANLLSSAMAGFDIGEATRVKLDDGTEAPYHPEDWAIPSTFLTKIADEQLAA